MGPPDDDRFNTIHYNPTLVSSNLLIALWSCDVMLPNSKSPPWIATYQTLWKSGLRGRSPSQCLELHPVRPKVASLWFKTTLCGVFYPNVSDGCFILNPPAGRNSLRNHQNADESLRPNPIIIISTVFGKTTNSNGNPLFKETETSLWTSILPVKSLQAPASDVIG